MVIKNISLSGGAIPINSTVGLQMSTNSNSWITCCGQVPRSQTVFLVQIVIAYFVIIVSLINIAISSEKLAFGRLWPAEPLAICYRLRK
jgi:hypothetical protein